MHELDGNDVDGGDDDDDVEIVNFGITQLQHYFDSEHWYSFFACNF